MSAVGEVLVRYLVDDDFRRAFERDPAGVLAELPLDADERAALLARDERVLELIGRSVGAPASEPRREPPAPASSEDAVASDVELPPIAVWLSVLPQATVPPPADSDGPARVRWQVSLHPAAPDEPALAAQRGVAFRIDLEPFRTTYQGAEHVVFRSAIGAHELDAAAAPTATSWEHDTQAPDVRAAVERVRAADAAERFRAVLDLAHTLRLRT